MCGIAGLLKTDGSPVSPAILKAMTAALAHRGPDGEGMELRGPAGLGHRRLAIIDLEGGRQPLSSEDEQIWVTFNGEIYNYRDLRVELEGRGHRFRTHSDTETIVYAYEEWGDRCVERFRGMFAFALLDLRRKRLFLARDHLGIKPLYFVSGRGQFAFASEIQALRQLPDLPLDLDLHAIDEYLRLQYIPAPRTVFRQIRKLLPAHRMSVSFDGRVDGPEEYWRLEFRPDYDCGEGEHLRRLDEVLRESVRAHLVSDVPFGAFLSGGVDSSAVVAYMAEILDRPVETFSIGFEEDEFSELTYAEQVARRWRTDHHIEVVKPEALEILPDLVRHFGEPFGDSSALPTYYVCRMARRRVPMVLSGDGGDEAFAGYDSHRSWMNYLSSFNQPAWRQFLRRMAGSILPHRYPARLPTLANWLFHIESLAGPARRALWREDYRAVSSETLDTFEHEFARTLDYPPGSAVRYLDLKTYLPFDILTKVDVASMMHGLEVRTPFVDVRVMELAATIPQPLLLARNDAGEWRGKLLFKKALERYYPREFLDRPKQGFAVPVKRWFAPEGALRGELHERLLGSGSTLNEFLDPAGIRMLLDTNAKGPLWVLLFLEEWLRQNRSRATEPPLESVGHA